MNILRLARSAPDFSLQCYALKNMITIKLKNKYFPSGSSRDGLYKIRTGRKIRIGYMKHRFQGNTLVPRYKKTSD